MHGMPNIEQGAATDAQAVQICQARLSAGWSLPGRSLVPKQMDDHNTQMLRSVLFRFERSDPRTDGQPGQHAARDRFEAGSSAQGQQGPGTSVPQRDAPGGGKGAGGSGGSSGVSWLGWLLGYGSNGGNGSGVKEGQLTDVAGDSRNSKGGGGRGDAGHIGSSVSDTGRQIQNEAGTAAQGNGGPAAPSGVEEGGSGRSKRGSATGTSSLAAK
eukprot:scaffold61815_cov22-Tisochrysis_lutea.AAC.1